MMPMDIKLRTPGLKWRQHGDKMIAYWMRNDRAKKAGYEVTSQRLWSGPVGTKPTEEEMGRISQECFRLQAEQRDFLSNPNLKKTQRYRQPGYVYFWRQGDAVKIGFTTTIRQRISKLQIGSAERGELLGVMPGSLDVEKFLHWLFRRNRRDGEWFVLDDELTRFIMEHARTPEERRFSKSGNARTADV
jgi:T5orf172 domain